MRRFVHVELYNLTEAYKSKEQLNILFLIVNALSMHGLIPVINDGRLWPFQGDIPDTDLIPQIIICDEDGSDVLDINRGIKLVAIDALEFISSDKFLRQAVYMLEEDSNQLSRMSFQDYIRAIVQHYDSYEKNINAELKYPSSENPGNTTTITIHGRRRLRL